MNKNNELKKDIFAIFIYILTFVVIYLILTTDNHLFASNVDFRTQHYLIPEYFRTLFYSTGNLFPDFAFNLGSSQNIYYLSYYGLLNPIREFSKINLTIWQNKNNDLNLLINRKIQGRSLLIWV